MQIKTIVILSKNCQAWTKFLANWTKVVKFYPNEHYWIKKRKFLV